MENWINQTSFCLNVDFKAYKSCFLLCNTPFFTGSAAALQEQTGTIQIYISLFVSILAADGGEGKNK